MLKLCSTRTLEVISIRRVQYVESCDAALVVGASRV